MTPPTSLAENATAKARSPLEMSRAKGAPRMTHAGELTSTTLDVAVPTVDEGRPVTGSARRSATVIETLASVTPALRGRLNATERSVRVYKPGPHAGSASTNSHENPAQELFTWMPEGREAFDKDNSARGCDSE